MNAATDDRWLNMANGGKQFCNLKCTCEHRAKISKANKNRKLSKETRTKMSISARGRTHSNESKEKMSKKMKGNQNGRWLKGIQKSKKHRKALSASLTGKIRPPFSKEWKIAIGEAKKGTVWINNGEVNRRVSSNFPIPDGFKRGKK